MKLNNDWLKHPLTIMAMGFGLTTIVGNAYINKMDTKKFATEQKILYQEKLLDKQIALSESMIVSLKGYIGVVHSIYNAYNSGSKEVSIDDLKQELKDCNWNKNKDIIGNKSKIYFRSDSIEIYLNQIDVVMFKGAKSNKFQFYRLFLKTPFDFSKEKKERDSILIQIAKNRMKIEKELDKILNVMRAEIQNFKKNEFLND
ncbi:MAG: hypothetical protein GQ564_22585 [Bacteroidales bacterium]|nr:hypothetical protein [Bacteroidales bacterium]